jgi:hypothetical protein
MGTTRKLKEIEDKWFGDERVIDLLTGLGAESGFPPSLVNRWLRGAA